MRDTDTTIKNEDQVPGDSAKNAVGTVLHLDEPDAGTRPLIARLEPGDESEEVARERKAHRELDPHPPVLIGPR